MFKKVMSGILISLSMAFLCISVFAVGQPCDNLVLYPEKTEVYVNSAIADTSKLLTGVVYASSTRNVYFRMKFRQGSVGWSTDTSYLVTYRSTDHWFYNRPSVNDFSSNYYWKFELDNYGVATKGGWAQGWMW